MVVSVAWSRVAHGKELERGREVTGDSVTRLVAQESQEFGVYSRWKRIRRGSCAEEGII